MQSASKLKNLASALTIEQTCEILDYLNVKVLDDYKTQAAALLGSSACVGVCMNLLNDGQLEIEFTVSLRHHDGYKLQELGSGATFFEALKNATEHRNIGTLRRRRDREGQRMQTENLRRKVASAVAGEVDKLKGGL